MKTKLKNKTILSLSIVMFIIIFSTVTSKAYSQTGMDDDEVSTEQVEDSSSDANIEVAPSSPPETVEEDESLESL